MGLRRTIGACLAASGPLLLVLDAGGAFRPAGGAPELHVAVDVTAALVSLLAARLLLGRFLRTLERTDLILAAALLGFAVVNLLLNALPAAFGIATGPALSWTALLGRVMASGMLVAAAYGRACPVRRPLTAARTWVVGSQVVVAGVAAALALAGVRTGPGDVAPVLSAVVAAALGGAAAGFARRARSTGDELLGWMAVAGVVGCCGWISYAVHGGAGDLLRMEFFIAVAAGAATEIRLAQAALAASAVQDARRRIARDLHDGTAQDLAFILQFARRLASGPDAPAAAPHVVTAAEHALAASREAITELMRSPDESLSETLGRAAGTVAARYGAQVDVRVPDDVLVPVGTATELASIVREAASNALRHGGARRLAIHVELDPRLRVRIADDGTGFDVDTVVGREGHYGLTGMRERVTALDGSLEIRSHPGAGTELEVVLP